MASPRFGLTDLVEGQAGGEVSVNERLARLEALLSPCILDRDLATPPGSPASGDLYLVATSPTGAWTGQAGKLALYLAGAWYFFTPTKGVTYWVADEKRTFFYDGSAFVYIAASPHNFRHAGGSSLEAWYIAGQTSGKWPGSTAATANVLRAFPFISPARGGTLDRIAINVTTGVAGNARIGIYTNKSDVDLYPAALVIDSGAIDTTSTANKKVTISQALAPNTLYWAVHVGSAAPTLAGFWMEGSSLLLGFSSALTTPQSGWSVAYTYGALPSTFPGSAAAITSEPNVAVFLRYSA